MSIDGNEKIDLSMESRWMVVRVWSQGREVTKRMANACRNAVGWEEWLLIFFCLVRLNVVNSKTWHVIEGIARLLFFQVCSTYVLKYVLCSLKNAVIICKLTAFSGHEKAGVFNTYTKMRCPFKLTYVSCSRSNVKVTLPFTEFLS